MSIILRIVSLVFLIPFVVHADDKEGVFFSADSFRFDNDMLAYDNDDRNYTYGMIWSWYREKAGRHYLFMDSLQNTLFQLYGDTINQYDNDKGFQISLTNFTPNQLSEEEVVADDRPYASLIASHSDVYKVDPNNKQSWGIGLTVGALGMDVGGIIQKSWHQFLRWTFNSDTPKEPKGWNNQISDGFEPTAKIDFSYHNRLNIDSSRTDIVWSADVSAGYYTYTSIGLVGKWGRINKCLGPHYVTKLTTPVSAGVKLVGDKARLSSDGEKLLEACPSADVAREAYLFGGARLNYVAYNALLQGTFISHSEHTFSSSDIEHGIFEYAAGGKMKLPYSTSTDLIISLNGRSPEFKHGLTRWHHWVGLTLDWRM
jgi:hypothetical protein